MCYTTFDSDEEKTGNKVATKFSGIFLMDYADQPFWKLIVEEALQHLSEKANGKALLQAIETAQPADDRGYNILITRMEPNYRMVYFDGDTPPVMQAKGGTGSWAKPALKSLGVASDAGSNGKGASAIVGWNQTQVKYTPPSGKNAGKVQIVPAPVTLGHELIHGLHALLGVNKSGKSIPINGKSTSEEEAQTVGLGPYADAVITENKLRKDFNLVARESYP